MRESESLLLWLCAQSLGSIVWLLFQERYEAHREDGLVSVTQMHAGEAT